MLDLTFYHKDHSVITVEVSELNYEKLCKAGLGKLIAPAEKELIIEGEKYEIEVIDLSSDNRKKILDFIEKERQQELESVFTELDDNPTIKEIREKFGYVKLLTSFYSKITNKECEYFSY